MTPPEDWRATIEGLRARLEEAFDLLAERARIDPELLARHPAGGGPRAWSGAEILEHVVLANRSLLLLVGKVRDKSVARAARGEAWPARPPALEVVAEAARAPRRWPHPEHMTPTGALAPAASARELGGQRARCLAFLAELPAGEGTLHRIRFSRIERPEEDADRLDLYQWLELIARHAARHAGQIDRTVADGAS